MKIKKLLALVLSLVMVAGLGVMPTVAEEDNYIPKEISRFAETTMEIETAADEFIPINPLLVINRDFRLTTTAWTEIGGENNLFPIRIRIANNHINAARGLGSIAVEVRDSRNNLLGSNQNIRIGYGITVNIPATSGRYTVRARASTGGINGLYNIVVSRVS